MSEEKESKENRESGNVEVQIMEEHVFIAQLQIQKEEEEALCSLRQISAIWPKFTIKKKKNQTLEFHSNWGN